ncbi:MAG: hypothetical protein FJ403_10755 [Verrucomicrobia bacterium]|nr:hypothetical protein [Verrucomicrobiota bacterium]
MNPGKQGVQIFDDEAGVFEEEQKRKVIDQADQQPNAAAAQERAQRHEQHEHAQRGHRWAQRLWPQQGNAKDGERGQC